MLQILCHLTSALERFAYLFEVAQEKIKLFDDTVKLLFVLERPDEF